MNKLEFSIYVRLSLTLVILNTVCLKVEVADACSSEVLDWKKIKRKLLKVAQYRLSLESGLSDSMHNYNVQSWSLEITAIKCNERSEI